MRVEDQQAPTAIILQLTKLHNSQFHFYRNVSIHQIHKC